MVNERRKQTGQQLLLRFEEGSDLRDRLEKIAKANGRSTTAEVLLRLKKSLGEDDNASAIDLDSIASRIEALKEEFNGNIDDVRADIKAIKEKLGMK